MTLPELIIDCIREAREQGYTGWASQYELTRYDCEWICSQTLAAWGRQPTREEWADAGHPGIDDAHVHEED